MTTPKLLISVAISVTAALATFALTSLPARAGAAETGRLVKFTYDRLDPPQRIYAHLRHTANQACEDHGSHSLKQDMLQRECADELLALVVARIGRTDLAEIHADRLERQKTAAMSSSGYQTAGN